VDVDPNLADMMAATSLLNHHTACGALELFSKIKGKQLSKRVSHIAPQVKAALIAALCMWEGGLPA